MFFAIDNLREIFQQLYSHIASAIIPVASIVAVPAAESCFPRQNADARAEWGFVASTLLRASHTDRMLIPSANLSSLQPNDDTDEDNDTNYQPSKRSQPVGRMDASSDDDDSDAQARRRRKAARDSQPKTVRTLCPSESEGVDVLR